MVLQLTLAFTLPQVPEGTCQNASDLFLSGAPGALRIYMKPFSLTFLSAFDVCSCLTPQFSPQRCHVASLPRCTCTSTSLCLFAHADSAAKNTLLFCFCLFNFYCPANVAKMPAALGTRASSQATSCPSPYCPFLYAPRALARSLEQAHVKQYLS